MITGKRILLRAWERPDLDAFMRWFNDPEVTIYLGNAYPALSSVAEERFIESMVEAKNTYCIVTRDEGVLIGNCRLFDVDATNRSAEIGIVIGEKAYWSQGYGREVLDLLLEIGFDGLGLNRICLRLVDFNARGFRAYQAAGFREEGRQRQAAFVKSAFHDMILMSVLAEEYRPRKSAG